MTQDDVIKLAREIADKDKDDPVRNGLVTLTYAEMVRLANAVEAKYRDRLLAGAGEPHYWAQRLGIAELEGALAVEREECAKVCEETVAQHYMKQIIPTADEALLVAACSDCASAIRARGNKT